MQNSQIRTPINPRIQSTAKCTAGDRSDFLPDDRKGCTAIAGKARESVSEYSSSCMDMHQLDALTSA